MPDLKLFTHLNNFFDYFILSGYGQMTVSKTNRQQHHSFYKLFIAKQARNWHFFLCKDHVEMELRYGRLSKLSTEKNPIYEKCAQVCCLSA